MIDNKKKKETELTNQETETAKIRPKITDVASYLTAIRDFSKADIVLYRGHGDESWRLQPSVGRERHYRANEKSIFLDFKRQYYLYADDRPSTDIDILFLAQHFGLPTRLLDWTYNPLVALWFACQEENVDGRIYIQTLKMRGQDGSLKEGHQLDFDIFNEKNQIEQNKLFIVPDYTVRRYFNQKGMFIWFKDPATIYDEFDKEFLIGREYKNKIIKELFTMGITQAFLLPSLENLCNDIRYGLSI